LAADILLLTVLLLCLYTDIKFKKIYNAVTFPAIFAAVILNLYLYGLKGGAESIKGLLAGMALLFIPFVMGGMGAGDVKLLGVVGAFKGPEFVWIAFLAMAITGGVISLALMLRSKNFALRLRAVFYTLLSLIFRTPRVQMLETIDSGSALTFPYGVAIVAGAVIAYLLR